jgi:chromosome segregation ATPase
MRANDIKKRFWSPVLGDTHSLFAELARVIAEINVAMGDQTGITDEQAAAIAELNGLLVELTKKAAELQEQTESLDGETAELEQKTAALQEAADGLEERIGKIEKEETIDHRDMTHRDAEGAHPMSAIVGLLEALGVLEGEISSAVSRHNTDAAAHGDIRLLIKGVSDRLNAIANSDDVTLDDFKEIVAYIKANKELIDSITASKVSVSDIVNDLETNAEDKPLSAAQGVALKGLIDESSALPKVTATDDGKFLQVIGGMWQAVSLTDVSAEGA